MGINNLTPADALDAQSARDHRMRAEGMREAQQRVAEAVDAILSVADKSAEMPMTLVGENIGAMADEIERGEDA